MKKMRKKCGAAVLALCLGLLCFCMVSQAAEDSVPPVSMEVYSIYGDMGKLGNHVPLVVSLYGQSEVPFAGRLSIRTLENGSDEDEEIYEYSYPVTVNMAETKRQEIYVPLGQRSSELYVSLTDTSGKELAGRTLSFYVSRDMGRLLVGALSDEPEELSYLDGVNLDYGMVSSSLIPMETDTFPRDARGLELLDILVINHYDTDKLSADQRSAIVKWVEKGGTLLFGTGNLAYEVLGAFSGEFSGLSVLETRKENVSLGAEYAEKSPGDSNVDMVYTELWIPGSTEVMESDGQPLLAVVKRGKGQAGFFSYDLGDIRDFVEKNPTYAVRLFTDILGEDTISQLYYYSSYGKEQEYWNAQGLVNTGSADRLPNVGLYSAAAVIYILVAGPGLYMLLKKRDKSRYYGGAVALTSIVASAVIYLMGTGTRFTSEFYTLATILDVEEETVRETSYLNIRTPDSRPFSVRFPGEYEITPLTRNSRYQEQPVLEFDKKKNANVEISYEEEGTVLSARRSRAFESRYFKLEQQGEKQFLGELEGELDIFDGKLTGYIKNGYSFPLSNAALFLYGQVYELGTLEPGEVREFDHEPLLNWAVNMSYIVSEWIAGGGEESADDGEYLRSVEKRGLYSYFIERFYETYTADVRVAALGPENGLWNFVSAEGQAADGQVLYTSRIPVNFERDGMIYRSGFMNPAEVTSGSGSFYSDGMAMYGSDPIAVEYFLGTDIEVEKLSFLPVSEELLDRQELYYLKIFDGDAYFYNYETKTYDRAELSKIDFSAGELEPYLSPENSLVVKYTVGETDSSGVSSLLPLLMVTGREV